MPFKFSDRHIEEYYHHGYTVFHGILPPALITDLRRATEAGRELARGKGGPQAQRLQPLQSFAERMDLKSFRDYTELPELTDALHRVLSPEHSLAGLERMGVLFEPANLPWCTAWHRDITERSDGIDPVEYRDIWKDATFFTQVNCALYTDTSTWYVPASDGRADISGEAAAASKIPALDGKSYEERERLGLEYCKSMPGAIQFVLEAGDFALYRPNGWHIGNYVPYRKRATIHDGVWKPATRQWYKKWLARLEALKEKHAVAVL